MLQKGKLLVTYLSTSS